MKTKSDIYKSFEIKSNEKRVRLKSAVRIFLVSMVVCFIVSIFYYNYRPEYPLYSYMFGFFITAICISSLFAIGGWFMAEVDKVSDELSVVDISKTLNFLDRNIPITDSKIQKLEAKLQSTKKELEDMKTAQKDSKELLANFTK